MEKSGMEGQKAHKETIDDGKGRVPHCCATASLSEMGKGKRHSARASSMMFRELLTV